MRTYQEVFKSSQEQIQRRLGLSYPPNLFISYRKYQGSKNLTKIRNRWLKRCIFSQTRPNVLEPSEDWDQSRFLNGPTEEFEETYFQLHHDNAQDEQPDESYLIEITVELAGKLTLGAAYDWLYLGQLKNGDHFAAVLCVRVRDLFKGCGLSNLVKAKEIELAKEYQCDFIQTYHKSENPDFLAAIAPSLKAGFVLFHGKPTAGEFYEKDGAIHLRKYLSRKARTDVKVTFTDGASFKSTKENHQILDYLMKLKDMPGKAIKKIDQYGEE